MYKKTLFFLTVALFAAGCTGGVSDLCTSRYDGKRTITQDRQCLSLVRASYLDLEADVNFVLLNPELVLGQPVNPNMINWEILAQPVNPN